MSTGVLRGRSFSILRSGMATALRHSLLVVRVKRSVTVSPFLASTTLGE